MIKSIKLRNFRNFEDKEFIFDKNKNFIIWENWKWKTNILEAISLFSWTNITKINFENLVNKSNETFFIENTLISWEKSSISYNKEENKKNFFLNSKKTNKKNLTKNNPIIVSFSPIIMNMMYLSPSLRREFLDEIIIKTFPEYSDFSKKYKNILISRNKILKNIREWKSEKSEIDFWNKKFIEISKIIYNFRFWIVNFLEENTQDFNNYFSWKIKKVKFTYKTKVSRNNLEKEIKQYLEKNFTRDIILASTQIWPHIDDFEILVDNISLTEYASRWEVKSIILWLKLLEIKFIEKFTNKKPILLIDDLLSELDKNHKDLLLKNINNHQTFITSIRKEHSSEWKIFFL